MRPGEALFNAKVSICSNFGITLTEADGLKVWQMNKLLAELDRAHSEEKPGKRPPGSVPVMT